MSGDPFDRKQFLQLLSALMDGGQLGEADRELLNGAVRDFPEARDLYRRHMDLHARLHLDYSGGLAPEGMPGEAPKQDKPGSTSRLSPPVLAIAAALVATLFTTSIFLLNPSDSGTVPDTTNGIAVLSESVGLEWPESVPRWQRGDAIAPGLFEIESGFAQIEFFCGATVVIEGPAKLEMVSVSKAVLHKGRLSAFVPEPAKGFVIAGPEFDTVDLGTEFAMSINDDGKSEVHVLDGEVELRDKQGSLLRQLTAGKSVKHDGPGLNLLEIEGQGQTFAGREQVVRMSGQRGKSRLSEWRRYRHKFADDADTIVYFDFEDHAMWDRQLRNARPDGPDGAIVGARWVTGRWPGKGALEFKRVSDRVRLDIPGEYRSLTLAAWIRIEGLDRRYNALFLTDGWHKGEPHWHIGNNGQLSFGISRVGTLHTEPLLDSGDLGRWLHLAVTFDDITREIRHYRDGKLMSKAAVSGEAPITIGASEIGNWQPGEAAARVRSFNGRLDEFLLSKRAFTSDEIYDHYINGDPYR